MPGIIGIPDIIGIGGRPIMGGIIIGGLIRGFIIGIIGGAPRPPGGVAPGMIIIGCGNIGMPNNPGMMAKGDELKYCA